MKIDMFGVKKVFSKQRFIEAEGSRTYEQAMRWVDDADGATVTPDNHCRGKSGITYAVVDEWCRYVPRDYDLNCKCVVQKGKKNTPAPRYRIVIECNGDTTTAEMQVNGRKVKQAQAKRNPADEFNWRIGAETAFGRLFEKKTAPAKQEERPFRVGDRVVCVSDSKDDAHVVGKHGRIVCMTSYGFGVEFDDMLAFGHSCNRHGKGSHCWYLNTRELRHE
jgi:hypothetical protein